MHETVAIDAPGRASCERLRRELRAQSTRTAGARTWAAMHETARMLLVSMCTEREPKAAALPWLSFTDAERDAMGAHARQLARDLTAAQWLR